MTEQEYTLIRSARRTLALELAPEGRLIVRAPRRLPLRDIESFVAAHGAWIEKHRRLQAERAALRPEPDEAARLACLARAREYIPERIAYFSRIMGVECRGLTITGARTRYGSCSGRDTLSFSWRVMLFDDAVVDYVVVHELAHIRYKNHSREFYDFIASFLPDHEARRAALRGAYRAPLLTPPDGGGTELR